MLHSCVAEKQLPGQERTDIEDDNAETDEFYTWLGADTGVSSSVRDQPIAVP